MKTNTEIISHNIHHCRKATHFPYNYGSKGNLRRKKRYILIKAYDPVTLRGDKIMIFEELSIRGPVFP